MSREGIDCLVERPGSEVHGRLSPTVIRRMDADDRLGVHSRTNGGGLYRSRGDRAIAPWGDCNTGPMDLKPVYQFPTERGRWRPRYTDLVQYACNRGRHQVGHRAGQHGTHAEAREISLAIRSQCADPADLDADRAQIRESAECKRSDGEGTRVKHSFLGAEHRKRDQFVENHARAE